MLKKLAILIGALGWLCGPALHAQDYDKYDKLTFAVGGGISTPLNPTAQFTGINGNFLTSAGYRLSKKSSINGEFMWSGLPGDVFVIQPTQVPDVSSNIYHLGANYRYQFDRVGDSLFGVYAIVGGGWYYRYVSLEKDYVVPPYTVCQPIWTWWGYTCGPGGYVYSDTVARKGTSGGGVNAGLGFTIALGQHMKFFTEARYHYAFHANIPTVMVPVSIGFRYH